MASFTYAPLPPPQEDAIHSTRLLAIEERPFQRVTRRLLDPKDSLLRQPVPRQLPSPPPDGEEEATSVGYGDAAKRQKFREEVLLDFALLENSLARIQLAKQSNERERGRYAAEKAKIVATAQNVRENTVLLREQLAEAQKVLELRKGYDTLASKILEDKKLKSRDETRADILGLEKEIEELEQEGREVEGLWTGRKEQFERVVQEGEAMRRVIKGIKEPEPGDEEEGDAMDEEGKEDRSRLGTPGMEDGRTPRPESGGRTPMPEGGTPLPESEGEERPRNNFLEVEDGGTRNTSRAASPGRQAGSDIEMGDSEPSAAEEQVLQEAPKASTGLQAADEQVKTPAGGAGEEMDES